ncbi:ribonuclease [Sphingopyxis sp. BSNA05]|uniref:ribonuclease E/G n=1 Tax=Sphingopyxis sp. BSNA05 TaxID=1236614 RepID=UPI001566B96F|nr:ribonuclease E/G [Sphingopyxis sp. BSNA05]NRD88539.1 ribonuclease [Sphingopyxis sp. BSNA05]
MADFAHGWLYEAGIGENRALRLENGELIQIRVERADGSIRSGAVVDAKFSQQWIAGKSGIVTLANGQEALLQPLPKGLTEGATVRVEIVRAAMTERGGQAKRAKARPAEADRPSSDGPDLLAEITATGLPVKQVYAHAEDILSDHGWHEAVEQAESGWIDFEGGSLLVSLTPAMTLFDVDGPLAPLELAKRAAKEIALALVRFDISGNIGVDFPTLEAKADRVAVMSVFDAHMTVKCERTVINGFGFMQIVSRKVRPSVLEILQANRAVNAALKLLRQAERDRGTGALRLAAHPAVANKLRDPLLDELARRTGRSVSVEPRGDISIDGGSAG